MVNTYALTGLQSQFLTRFRARSFGKRKEQLIAVGIVDLDRVVPPPGFLVGNRPLAELTPKICEPVRGQLYEEASPVSARDVLTVDDLALSVIDLADFARAIAFMPALLEAEHVDLKTKRAVDVANEENRARVPPVNNLASYCLLRHSSS